MFVYRRAWSLSVGGAVQIKTLSTISGVTPFFAARAVESGGVPRACKRARAVKHCPINGTRERLFRAKINRTQGSGKDLD